MADNTTSTRASAEESHIERACAALAYVGDRLALLIDIFEGDGLARRGDFSLSARGAEAVMEMLCDMDTRLDEARQLLMPDGETSA